MGERKGQLTIYLAPETLRALEAYAAKRAAPKSLVAEAAIASFLSGDDADRREAAIARRLDRIGRLLERLERNDLIALETLAMFVRNWLTATPALPEHAGAAARAQGHERYLRFIETLGRRLANGTTLAAEVSRDIDAAFGAGDRP